MIVESSDVCEAKALATLNFIETGPSAYLCLYTNDLPLTPDTEVLGSFVEANYGGYARIATLGSWVGPFRDKPGSYHIQSGPWTFATNTGPSSQQVYGWFLLRGSRVIETERFDGGPLTIAVTRPGPTLLLQLTTVSLVVACPPT